MPLSIGLKSKCIAILDNIAVKIAPLQDAYFTKNGEYWQGKATHDSLPKDGVGKPPIKTKKQTDHPDWNDFGIGKFLPVSMECCVEVIAQNSSSGNGYIIQGRTEQSKVEYIWQKNVGIVNTPEEDWG